MTIPLVDLNELFAGEDMILPCGYAGVLDFAERQRILDEIAKRGWTLKIDHEGKELPTAEELFAGESAPVINIWPTQRVQIDIFHWDTQAFEFQFDIREMETQPDLDAVCDFVWLIGGVTQRPVELRWEGSEIAFYTYDPALDRFSSRS